MKKQFIFIIGFLLACSACVFGKPVLIKEIELPISQKPYSRIYIEDSKKITTDPLENFFPVVFLKDRTTLIKVNKHGKITNELRLDQYKDEHLVNVYASPSGKYWLAVYTKAITNIKGELTFLLNIFRMFDSDGTLKWEAKREVDVTREGGYVTDAVVSDVGSCLISLATHAYHTYHPNLLLFYDRNGALVHTIEENPHSKKKCSSSLRNFI